LLTVCSILVDNLGQAVRTQLVDKPATRCEIFTRVVEFFNQSNFIYPRYYFTKTKIKISARCDFPIGRAMYD
jgi:hypothetical protein